MSRDFWSTTRAAVKVDRIKKSLTVPAASYTTFRRKACLEYNVSDANNNFFSVPDVIATAFTFELWVKPLSAFATKQTILKFGESTPQFEFSILNNVLTATTWAAGSPTNIIATGYVLPNIWTHIAATYDNVTFKLYVNGALISSSALAGPVDAGSLFAYLAQSSASTDLFIGRIGELRIWNIARTSEQLLSFYKNPRNAGMYDVTGLVHYYKCNGVTLVSGNEGDQISVLQKINASSTKFTTEDAPPLEFGASFSAADIDVVLTHSVSFKFPVAIPDDCTGMLVVRWLDDDGVLQRRKFWSLEGVSINPEPAMYNGEAVSASFTLEWWNIDGDETLEVPDDIILYLSKTTTPTTSYDATPISAATLSPDITIGEPFPLTFPLTFNTAQTYS